MHARGKRAAFGDGRKIIWGPWSEEIFRHNPNVAKPGSESKSDLIWVDYYKGHRKYNSLDPRREKWIWNYEFKASPGEFFFCLDEIAFYQTAGKQYIFVEPNVPWHKSVAPNKDWGLVNYQAVVDLLLRDGHEVVQTRYGREKLKGVRFVTTPTFRHAVAIISQAKAVLTPEGGMHHAAAAVGVPAVVLFGGFIPPAVTGYDAHTNLTGGVDACGSILPCLHCRDAMKRISVEEVYQAVKSSIG